MSTLHKPLLKLHPMLKVYSTAKAYENINPEIEAVINDQSTGF